MGESARSWRAQVWALATVVAGGCMDSDRVPGAVAADVADVPVADATLAVDAHAPLQLPAKSLAVHLLGVTAEGQAFNQGPAVQVKDGKGQLVVNGKTYPLLLFYGLNFSGFDLACGLALGDDQWYAVWLYCKSGGLVHLWLTGTAGLPLVDLLTTGTCEVSYIPKVATWNMPQVALPRPATESGFTVNGPSINLRDDLADGTSGRLWFGGRWLAAWVYEIIDCLDCGLGGWWELHLLAQRPGEPHILSTIVYLYRTKPGEARLGWSAWVPELAQIPLVALPANWTVTAK
jgi:hypothetical protein